MQNYPQEETSIKKTWRPWRALRVNPWHRTAILAGGNFTSRRATVRDRCPGNEYSSIRVPFVDGHFPGRSTNRSDLERTGFKPRAS